MSATHIIIGGVVVNTIVATIEEAQAAYPDAVCIPADIGGIGWLWDGESLAPPPPVPAAIPAAVTMRQARLALLGAGLYAEVNAAIDSLPSPQKEAARIEWEYATEVQRVSGLVPMMVVALGLDDAALDALFIEAAAL